MKTKSRGKTEIVCCECCGIGFEARVADIKRGWGRFCSKSCKAQRQTIEPKKNSINTISKFLDCGNKNYTYE
jgi:hypothetical protein